MCSGFRAVACGVTMIVAPSSVVRPTQRISRIELAHAGYLLLGIVAANSAGKAAILFYLLAYAVTNIGALGIVALLGTPQNQHDTLRDFAGLWRSRPALAGLMTVFLLSLGGIPPTAGFIGKWYIFTAAIREGHYWLATIGVLTSVVSVFFYLRIVVMMYMTEGPETCARGFRCGRRGPGAADRRFLPRYPAHPVLDLALARVRRFFWDDPPPCPADRAYAVRRTQEHEEHEDLRLHWAGYRRRRRVTSGGEIEIQALLIVWCLYFQPPPRRDPALRGQHLGCCYTTDLCLLPSAPFSSDS